MASAERPRRRNHRACLEFPLSRAGNQGPPVPPARSRPPCGPGCGSDRGGGALRHGNHATGLQQVEGVAALQNEIRPVPAAASIDLLPLHRWRTTA